MLPNQLTTENLSNWMFDNGYPPYQAYIVCDLKDAGYDYQPMLTSKLCMGYIDIYNLIIRGNYSVDVIQKSTLTDKEMSILVAYIDRTYDLINLTVINMI